MTTIGSLFSGYGGLDLAALQLVPGSRVVWHCEWEKAPSRILDHHWPGVPNLHDVTQVDWTQVEPVDVLTGGYPCQPFSAAGRRQGTEDERHLWPYVREAIRHLRPRFTLLENVAGHRSLGFDRVLGDLAEDGFDAEWTSIRASDIGAPHHRERLFILVHAADPGSPAVGELPGSASSEEAWEDASYRLGDPGGERSDRDWREGSPDAPNDGRGEFDDCAVGDASCSAGVRLASGGDRREVAAHAQDKRCSTRGLPEREESAVSQPDLDRRVDWGAYAAAVRRWERLTRQAPAPTELNRNGKPRLSAAFAEWMMGLPAGWVTDPSIGITRAEQLKAIGNGVCPQQAAAAFSGLFQQVAP
ncbi:MULTISPECIES: DNA cytosine methyltransferase [Rhodococcus]|uniref:DNA cytosine methyltransferase n=1 Tax=Rhodococcus TaxID=1827 RepID=UPI003556D4A0